MRLFVIVQAIKIQPEDIGNWISMLPSSSSQPKHTHTHTAAAAHSKWTRPLNIQLLGGQTEIRNNKKKNVACMVLVSWCPDASITYAKSVVCFASERATVFVHSVDIRSWNTEPCEIHLSNLCDALNHVALSCMNAEWNTRDRDKCRMHTTHTSTARLLDHRHDGKDEANEREMKGGGRKSK